MRRRLTDKLYASPSKMARCARRWFKIFYQEIEPEFADAPPLPLCRQEQFWLMSMKAGSFGYLVGCYAESLKAHDYPSGHPLPPAYIRGVMACSSLPKQVRTDPEMLRRFPPDKLEGLDESTMIWSPAGSDGQKAAA